MSHLENQLLAKLALVSPDDPIREHRFHPPRMFRFDFSYPKSMVAVEVEGGTWVGGRHTTGKGFESDCVKYNLAAIDGWLVIRVTAAMIADGRAVEFIQQALAMRS